MQVAILGGGLSGLAAAYALSGKCRVTVYEARDVPGGCIASVRMGKSEIEEFYHHAFPGDEALFSLLGRLGLGGDLEWRTATTGYCIGGAIYPLTTPLEILKYPYLSLIEKARLARLTLRARSMDYEALDQITAREFVEKEAGTRIYEAFFAPLLNSKFGPMAGEVSAAWLVGRIAIRSHRGMRGESLGYLRGGFGRLASALIQAIEGAGGTVRTGVPVTRVNRKEASWEVNGECYDAVIGTAPPEVLTQLGFPGVPVVPYQGAACLTLGISRDVTNGIYWLNMGDEAPYGAVISHTNFIPKERYGTHIVYLASYFTGEPRADIREVMESDFSARFHISPVEILARHLVVNRYAGPVYATGLLSKIPPYSLGNGFYLAGMVSRPNYPERSMEGSIRAGFEVAELLSREGPCRV
ncbi:MAG: NAD(P)/FAD-dependent oxidoreductase [Methanomicrobiales archaeon]|nr:NAD(P)/FAD-dependent oxidoreductase [Methanomicrobiales archaeon]